MTANSGGISGGSGCSTRGVCAKCGCARAGCLGVDADGGSVGGIGGGCVVTDGDSVGRRGDGLTADREAILPGCFCLCADGQ